MYEQLAKYGEKVTLTWNLTCVKLFFKKYGKTNLLEGDICTYNAFIEKVLRSYY
jgi:hypothetical protein